MKTLWTILAILIMASGAWGANTFKYGTNTVEISAIDTDYAMISDATLGSPSAGMYIKFIQFKPSAANDKICVLDGTGGPALMDQTDITGGGLIIYPGLKCKPFIDFSACTFNTAANVKVIIGFKYSEFGER